MAQNVIYWKFDTDTLYIRGTSASGYTTWSIPSSYSYTAVPWYSNRSSITSVIFETSIDVTTMRYWFRDCSNLVSITNFNYIQSVTNMNYCFYGCTSFNQPITIPNSVTSILGCFYNCTSFNQSITIPNSVTSMESCFYSCEAFDQPITIPSSVTTMYSCFEYCTSFNQPITIPNSVTNMSYCFYSCTALNSTVTFQDTSKVTSMYYCFQGCASFNQSITIPNSVTSMYHCFYGCKTFNSTVTFQDTSKVTDMDYCFYNCEAFNQSITIPSSVTTMYDCFQNCTSFNQPITIPNSVTNMGYCFENCTALNSTVTFQDTSKVTNMNNCFYNCEDFDQPITIPDSVTNMGYCFYKCKSFNQPITIPSSVTNMSYCFYNCTALNSTVTFQDTSKVTTMGYCFSGCTSFNQSITIPSSVTSIIRCFENCTALNSTVTFQDTIKITNMNYCFYNCTSFNQSITIPNSVTSMESCFYSCEAFDQPITIPSSVTTMYSCFQNCTSFNQSITIPNSVVNMYHCFDGCKTFNSTVTFQDTSKVVNMVGCFSGCEAFDQPITISNSVTTMYSCFQNCTSFNQPITIPDSVTSMYHCFQNCTSFNQPITIPDSVTNIISCFYNCTSFNQSITIPDSVTSMERCFYNCEDFDQPITIPDSVTNMGYCFYGCTSFNQSITIPNSVTNMSYCFYNCKNLNSIIIINKTDQALSYEGMFFGTEKSIILGRSSTISIESLIQLSNTSDKYNVKVSTLSLVSNSATRNSENSSQIDIVVEVTDAYSHNIDIDICNSPNTSSSRPDVLWYSTPEYIGNPLNTLTINSSEDTTTFYGLIEDINTDNSLSLFVIAYYNAIGISDTISTSFQELRIPSSYYTMDFLAGGKEIAIGINASPDDVYSEVNNVSNIPFTGDRFITSDTNVNMDKVYYKLVNSQYQLVDLSGYTEEELDVINPSIENNTYNTPWYDVLQEQEFYQKNSSTEYVRLYDRPTNWYDLPIEPSTSIGQTTSSSTSFEYNIDNDLPHDIGTSTVSGKWKILIGTECPDLEMDKDWKFQFEYGVSKTYKNLPVMSTVSDSLSLTISYDAVNDTISIRSNDFPYTVNYFIKYSPLYFTLSSTRGIFKCGMDAIFRSKQAPEVFKSMYDLMYPVGSCYTTSTYTNPGQWLGGTWTFINKYHSPLSGSKGDGTNGAGITWNSSTTQNDTSSTGGKRGWAWYLTNGNLMFRFIWYSKVVPSDDTLTIATIDATELGVSGREIIPINTSSTPSNPWYYRFTGWADGANAVLLCGINWSRGTGSKAGHAIATLYLYDWVTRTTSYPTGTNQSCNAQVVMPLTYGFLSNSICNQFIWKRIS